MDGRPREIKYYVAPDDRVPAKEWLNGLKDRDANVRIRKRIDKLEAGLFGDCERLSGGIVELRLDFGPGYRLYVGEDGPELVLLLVCGTKKTQQSDIELARKYWKEYNS
jgi:putative addiction module killer protein